MLLLLFFLICIFFFVPPLDWNDSHQRSFFCIVCSCRLRHLVWGLSICRQPERYEKLYMRIKWKCAERQQRKKSLLCHPAWFVDLQQQQQQQRNCHTAAHKYLHRIDSAIFCSASLPTLIQQHLVCVYVKCRVLKIFQMINCLSRCDIRFTEKK